MPDLMEKNRAPWALHLLRGRNLNQSLELQHRNHCQGIQESRLKIPGKSKEISERQHHHHNRHLDVALSQMTPDSRRRQNQA